MQYYFFFDVFFEYFLKFHHFINRQIVCHHFKLDIIFGLFGFYFSNFVFLIGNFDGIINLISSINWHFKG